MTEIKASYLLKEIHRVVIKCLTLEESFTKQTQRERLRTTNKSDQRQTKQQMSKQADTTTIMNMALSRI